MPRRTCGNLDPHCGRSFNLHPTRKPRKRVGVPRPSKRFMRYLKQRYIADYWARWRAVQNLPPVYDEEIQFPQEETTMRSQVFGTWGNGAVTLGRWDNSALSDGWGGSGASDGWAVWENSWENSGAGWGP